VFQLLVGLLVSLSALGQPAFLTNGLVAYYPLNGNANDEIFQSRYDGAANNVMWDIDRFNRIKSSARFSYQGWGDETEEYIKLPDSVGDILQGTNDFSISAWIKFGELKLPENRPEAPWSSFLLFDAFGGDSKYFLGWTLQVNKTTFSPSYIVISNGQRSGFGRWDSFQGQKEATNWCQVVLVASGTNSAKIYINSFPFAMTGSPDYSFPRPAASIKIGNWFNGNIDDFRIYNRAISDAEVKSLYTYESAPPRDIQYPRIATANAQVVNGFVVGATINDAGYGYNSNPTVTITGGGGTGAKATATQVNGVVTSINITNPGSGYTSAPMITIAPPPFPPRKAASTAQIVNGFVVGTKITDSGFGYDSPPTVLIVGGGGSGATAVATVANGVVTGINITNPGTGYTSAPLVRIASPPFVPKLGIETSKVFVRMSVVLGRKYQLEASTDLNIWTTTGPAFIAQDEELVQEFDVNQVGRYFRINQVP
jgi:hypothetical protein